MRTYISLEPGFLKHLGIHAVDATLPEPPLHSLPIVIHPSFLKDLADRPLVPWPDSGEPLAIH